jgi:hypothetical protein
VTRDEHRARHVLLHKMLDELAADYFSHVREAMPSNTTLTQLMKWSYAQTIDPADLREVRDADIPAPIPTGEAQP